MDIFNQKQYIFKQNYHMKLFLLHKEIHDLFLLTTLREKYLIYVAIIIYSYNYITIIIIIIILIIVII